MLRQMLRAKIHRATVTEACLEYEGSITVDEDLLDAAGILPYELVMISNLNNGERCYEFYAEDEAKRHQPKIILVDDKNHISHHKPSHSKAAR